MPEPLPDERAALPAYPDRGDDAEHPSEGRSWAGILVVALLAGLFVLVIVLHLTGVIRPGGH